MKTRVLWASLAVAGGLLLVALLTWALAVQAQGPMAGSPGPWTKYEGNPVIVTGTVGSWDANTVVAPIVISDGTTYKIWYAGLNAASIYSIGYATSTNGITWTKYAGNPVITGTAGNWDANAVTGDVVFDGATYHTWYWGGPGSIPGSAYYAIGYATSTNGITWTKYASNPVITSTAGSWDSKYILCPCVISDTGLYKMWYTGIDDIGTWSIGYTTSTNGISWNKYSGNPVLQTGLTGSWDASQVLCPDVILDGTTYRCGTQDRMPMGPDV